jgi:hypothetical protein
MKGILFTSDTHRIVETLTHINDVPCITYTVYIKIFEDAWLLVSAGHYTFEDALEYVEITHG